MDKDKDKDKDKDGDKDRYRGNRDYRDYHDQASADSYGYSDDSDAGYAFIVLSRHLTYYNCYADFIIHSATRAHIRDYTPFKLFDSCNQLFKHLKLCEDAKKGFFRPRPESEFGSSDESDSDESVPGNAFNTKHIKELPAEEADDFEVQIAPAQLVEQADSRPISSYTHLRAQARATEKSGDAEICLDPGAGRSLIDSRFLKQLLTEWVTFDLFLVDKNAAGKNALLKITKSAWVVDSYLGANLLLGNDFMHPAKAEFRYEDCSVHFTAFGDFACQFEILNRAVYFEAKHDAAINAVVDAKTPKVVMMRNPTNGTLKIHKSTKLGSI
ncbi:hypothetical protein B0T22DRAFT_485712 [Podospora appendiculata]|uniref:Uncharacterized protein n=1 Tax=Podospora appendiculata TaxID=314037 RepID=A0AAE1C795_9PEZI|nr:hypothetical protein B0T22DRAFT_485712 [Podospora appendiculata]